MKNHAGVVCLTCGITIFLRTSGCTIACKQGIKCLLCTTQLPSQSVYVQIKDEMKGCLDFLQHVYGIFGFSFNLVLSTRPEKFMGEIEIWNTAEKQLAESLDDFGTKWEYNHGDGAFYGPKIDITILDALKRKHQCATIQLDFQLPTRFNLTYATYEF